MSLRKWITGSTLAIAASTLFLLGGCPQAVESVDETSSPLDSSSQVGSDNTFPVIPGDSGAFVDGGSGSGDQGGGQDAADDNSDDSGGSGGSGDGGSGASGGSGSSGNSGGSGGDSGGSGGNDSNDDGSGDSGVPEIGDLNGDGVIDVVDLQMLLATYGITDSSLAGDLTGDGVVDIADLSALVELFAS